MALSRLLQENINHCISTQDLLLQSMALWLSNIAVVAEPYFVPPRDDWVDDLNFLVTPISSAAAGTPSLMAARFRKLDTVGYTSSRTVAEFHNSFAELRVVVM